MHWSLRNTLLAVEYLAVKVVKKLCALAHEHTNTLTDIHTLAMLIRFRLTSSSTKLKHLSRPSSASRQLLSSRSTFRNFAFARPLPIRAIKLLFRNSFSNFLQLHGATDYSVSMG